jgi:hypothetical protein
MTRGTESGRRGAEFGGTILKTAQIVGVFFVIDTKIAKRLVGTARIDLFYSALPFFWLVFSAFAMSAQSSARPLTQQK